MLKSLHSSSLISVGDLLCGCAPKLGGLAKDGVGDLVLPEGGVGLGVGKRVGDLVGLTIDKLMHW